MNARQIKMAAGIFKIHHQPPPPHLSPHPLTSSRLQHVLHTRARTYYKTRPYGTPYIHSAPWPRILCPSEIQGGREREKKTELHNTWVLIIRSTYEARTHRYGPQ